LMWSLDELDHIETKSIKNFRFEHWLISAQPAYNQNHRLHF
jgi:hypothetical protein